MGGESRPLHGSSPRPRKRCARRRSALAWLTALSATLIASTARPVSIKVIGTSGLPGAVGIAPSGTGGAGGPGQGAVASAVSADASNQAIAFGGNGGILALRRPREI